MSNKNVEPERVRKGPMTVEEIKAMRAAEGMIVDLEDEGTNVYVIKAYQEKMSVAVGRMYKQARKEMGLTQQEVADVSGVKRPNIARLESGKHSPTVDMLNRIAASLGMDMDIHLWKGNGNSCLIQCKLDVLSQICLPFIKVFRLYEATDDEVHTAVSQ